MKKVRFLIALILVLGFTTILSGCNSSKILNKLTEKGYFLNSYDDAILQTDIVNKITAHFNENTNPKKKAILITIDGMRAESLEYIMGNDLGFAAISKTGGLYWTKPANLDSKAKIDVGVNFLSIVTGQEPSTFNVLKSTDAKREKPYSIISTISTMSEKYSVKFLTDNKAYIDMYLAAEIKAMQSQKLSCVSCVDLNAVRTECLNDLSGNDFITVAISNPYVVAAGNYKMSNAAYLASLLHLNYYIDDLYSEITNRTKANNEDWLVIVTTTCGGNTKLAANKEEGNILTFMLSNKVFNN